MLKNIILKVFSFINSQEIRLKITQTHEDYMVIVIVNLDIRQILRPKFRIFETINRNNSMFHQSSQTNPV